MKFIAQFLLIIVGSYFAQLYFPWWSLVVVAGIAGLLFAFENSRKSFYTGFFAILVSWTALAYFTDILNEGVFSDKMSSVLEGFTMPVLILLPAILGGILAGFASMTGNLLRNLFVKPQSLETKTTIDTTKV